MHLMVLAVSGKGNWFFLTLGSIATGMASLFSQEFYVGLELLRPLLIWLAIRDKYPNLRERAKKTLYFWGPYLIIYIGYFYWRFLIMPTPGVDRNTPKILMNLFHSPFQALPSVITMVIKDLVNGLIGSWYRTIDPSLIELIPISNLIAWGLVGVIFTGLIVAFFKVRILKEDNENGGFIKGAITLGFLAMVLGFAPGWSIGRTISDLSGRYNDRFGLAAMLGASLLVVGLFEGLFKSRQIRTIVLCFFIALAVGQHFRSTSIYRWSWEQQSRFFWQLKWRAPYLKPPTAIFGDGALINFMGSWATISAINEVYNVNKWLDNQPYWYFDLTKNGAYNIISSEGPITDSKEFLDYFGTPNDKLVIQAKGLPVQCLWVLEPEDRYNPYLTSEVKNALPFSNINLIEDSKETSLNKDIFGPEISHDWCYFYEKATFARQMGDWQNVLALWKEAESTGLSPSNSPEFAPFIEAAAHTGDWNLAIELTERANIPNYIMHDYLCTIWGNIDMNTGMMEGKRDALKKVASEFDCQKFIK